MLKLLLISVVVLVAVCAVDVDDQEWDEYKELYGKSYESEVEEAYRRKIYKENKIKVEKHNARFQKGEESFQMGINRFTDMLSHEVADTMHGLKQKTKGKRGGKRIAKRVDATLHKSVEASEE